jgi:hypothetical protein
MHSNANTTYTNDLRCIRAVAAIFVVYACIIVVCVYRRYSRTCSVCIAFLRKQLPVIQFVYCVHFTSSLCDITTALFTLELHMLCCYKQAALCGLTHTYSSSSKTVALE